MYPVKPRKGARRPLVTTAYRVIGAWIAGFHTGTDFGWTRKTEYVRATWKGRVWKVGKGDRHYGNYVVILHPDGSTSWFCHLASIRKSIKVGKSIGTGRWLGIMGATGNASGRHLHHEERNEPHGYNNHRAPRHFTKPRPRRLVGWV